MKVTREHGLVLNKTKCEVKSNSVKFFGCVYDRQGAHPHPSKVSAIKEMPAPQNKGELQRMVRYLSQMVVADTLSGYSPEDTLEILLDISVNHTYIDAKKK